MSMLPFDQRPLIFLCEAYDSLGEGLELVLGDRYAVNTTARVAELPTLLERQIPSLLIVDVDEQPTLYDVLVPIRKQHPSLPILLLARDFSLEQQMEALRRLTSVAVAFMTKPYPLEQLLEKVETLIQGYSSSPIRTRVIRIAR